MHVDADAVAHKIPHHRETLGFNHSLHRGAYVAQGCPRPYCCYARVQRRFSHRQKPRGLRIDLAHRHGNGRVAIKAVYHRSKIERNNVPFFEDPLWRRDAMHYLAIDRGAQHGRKPVIPLEGGLDAQLGKPAFRRLLQIERGGARLHAAAHQLEHVADDPARAAHLFDLQGRLQYDRHSPSLQLSVISCQLSVFAPSCRQLTTYD